MFGLAGSGLALDLVIGGAVATMSWPILAGIGLAGGTAKYFFERPRADQQKEFYQNALKEYQERQKPAEPIAPAAPLQT